MASSRAPEPSPAATKPDPKEVAVLVTDAARRRNGPLLGTQISALVNSYYPTFDYLQYGVSKLRDFIKVHVPELTVVGRQGADLLYDLKERVPAPSPTQPAPASLTTSAEESVWRAFSSPNSTNVVTIQVNIETGQWRTGAAGMPADGAWQTVRPLDAEIHQQIAKEFIESLPQSTLRHELESALRARYNWWNTFRQILAVHPDEFRRYQAHRTERIRGELANALTALGLAAGAHEAALGRAHPPVVVVPAPSSSLKKRSARGDLRSLVLELVSRLPESEMRELRIRVGDVFDLLQDI